MAGSHQDARVGMEQQQLEYRLDHHHCLPRAGRAKDDVGRSAVTPGDHTSHGFQLLLVESNSSLNLSQVISEQRALPAGCSLHTTNSLHLPPHQHDGL